MNTYEESHPINSKPHESDEHIIKMWTAFKIDVDANYDFVPSSFFYNLFASALRIVAGTILYVYNRIAFGLKVTGLENIANISTGAITVCNHMHFLDATMIGTTFKNKVVYFPTLKSNLEIPVIRWLVRWLGGIPIPSTPKAFGSFNNGIEKILKQNNFVHFYPEGSLWPYHNGIRDFKKGAFHMAIRYNVPIIPLVMTYRPATGIRKYFNKKPLLTLNILEPIYPNNHQNERIEAIHLCNQVKEIIDHAYLNYNKI